MNYPLVPPGHPDGYRLDSVRTVPGGRYRILCDCGWKSRTVRLHERYDALQEHYYRWAKAAR
jgi:hypothetical protein